MYVKKCFEVRVEGSRGVGVVPDDYYYYSHHPFSSKKIKQLLHLLPVPLPLPTTCSRGSRVCSSATTISLPPSSSSCSSFAHSFSRRCNSSRIICKAREAVDEVTHCSWNNLVIASETPVLVEFWAPRCRMIAPVVEELAGEYGEKIQCYKLNTDDWPNIATQYEIRSVPTVVLFKDGERKESIIGAVPKSTLTATIDKYLDT